MFFKSSYGILISAGLVKLVDTIYLLGKRTVPLPLNDPISLYLPGLSSNKLVVSLSAIKA